MAGVRGVPRAGGVASAATSPPRAPPHSPPPPPLVTGLGSGGGDGETTAAAAVLASRVAGELAVAAAAYAHTTAGFGGCGCWRLPVLTPQHAAAASAVVLSPSLVGDGHANGADAAADEPARAEGAGGRRCRHRADEGGMALAPRHPPPAPCCRLRRRRHAFTLVCVHNATVALSRPRQAESGTVIACELAVSSRRAAEWYCSA